MKIPDMPSKIKIGTQTFKVIIRSPQEDGMLNDSTYGYTLDGSNIIVISGAISATKQRTTFLHEMLHAIAMTYGSSTKPSKDSEFEDWEHHFIGIYEETLLVILKENPEIAAYLSA